MVMINGRATGGLGFVDLLGTPTLLALFKGGDISGEATCEGPAGNRCRRMAIDIVLDLDGIDRSGNPVGTGMITLEGILDIRGDRAVLKGFRGNGIYDETSPTAGG